jgi:hypothetical protein
MRKLWKLSMAVVLTLVLAPYALAGITDTPPAPVPPPEPPSTSAMETIETPPSSAQPRTLTNDPLVDVALNLLKGALSLF